MKRSTKQSVQPKANIQLPVNNPRLIDAPQDLALTSTLVYLSLRFTPLLRGYYLKKMIALGMKLYTRLRPFSPVIDDSIVRASQKFAESRHF